MIHQALCEAFCSDVLVTPVPIGFAVRTPHLKPDGDFAAFYLRKEEGSADRYRIEDDGCTVADLEASGFDLDKETRLEAFTDLLAEHKVRFDDRDVLLATEYMPASSLPKAAISFSYFMARIPDLLLLVGNRVRKSFKEDLAEIIEQQFADSCEILYNSPIDKAHRDYIVDFVIRAPDGRILAVFAGSSELKALESLLFWEQIKTGDYSNVKPMIVLEEAKPVAIKDRTLSRVMNSGLVLATLDGDVINVGEKLKRTLGKAA
jgi:hypothetical protein